MKYDLLGADHSKFHGDYVEGRKEGRGRYEWADGSYYDGEWNNNRITGYGVYCWSDGRGYKGRV